MLSECRIPNMLSRGPYHALRGVPTMLSQGPTMLSEVTTMLSEISAILSEGPTIRPVARDGEAAPAGSWQRVAAPCSLDSAWAAPQTPVEAPSAGVSKLLVGFHC